MARPDMDRAIDAIARRPGMFLRRRSLRELTVFLSGYCFGLDATRPPEEFPHGEELREFRRWLAARLHKEAHPGEREDWLIAESGDDAEKAFDAFFVLWDELRSGGAR